MNATMHLVHNMIFFYPNNDCSTRADSNASIGARHMTRSYHNGDGYHNLNCCCLPLLLLLLLVFGILSRHNMTNVPRTIEDVEAVMAGADWPVGAEPTSPAAKKPCVR